MPQLGPWELIIVLLIVVVIFGAGRLSDIGGALGKGIREFRSATKDDETPSSTDSDATATPVVTSPAGTTVVTPAAAAAENKCPSCGTVNPPTQQFCGQCGTRLAVKAA